MNMRLILTVLLSTILITKSLANADESAIQNVPTSTLEWATTPEGVAFAPLVGDRFAEAYMSMVKLPSGLISPPHTKTSNMFGVIISGSMVHSEVGTSSDNEVVLPEGSFYKIPKNIAHISKCVSETECITFLYQDGKFDFLLVDTEVSK